MNDDDRKSQVTTRAATNASRVDFPAKPVGGFAAYLSRWSIDANTLTQDSRNNLMEAYRRGYELTDKLAEAIVRAHRSVAKLDHIPDLIAEDTRQMEAEFELAAFNRQLAVWRREDEADRFQREAQEAKAQHHVRMATLKEQVASKTAVTGPIIDRNIADAKTQAAIARTNLSYAEAAEKSAKETANIFAAEEQKLIAAGDFKKLDELRKARDAGQTKKRQQEDPDQLDLNALLDLENENLRAAKRAGRSAEVIDYILGRIMELEDMQERANAAANALK